MMHGILRAATLTPVWIGDGLLHLIEVVVRQFCHDLAYILHNTHRWIGEARRLFKMNVEIINIYICIISAFSEIGTDILNSLT